MRSPVQISIALPSFARFKTTAAWPVWRDSARADVKFHPLPKRQAVRLFHEARCFERQTRMPGRQDGAPDATATFQNSGLRPSPALASGTLGFARSLGTPRATTRPCPLNAGPYRAVFAVSDRLWILVASRFRGRSDGTKT